MHRITVRPPPVPFIMRWPSKPTRRCWLAFLRTPLTPLVLVPRLYFDAARLQSYREAGLVSTIITELFFGLGRNSGSYFDPRGAVVADGQDGVRILTTEQAYGNAGWDNPADGVIATLHLEPRPRHWGLWTRETRLFTRTLTVFVVSGDTPPRPTLEHWVDLWTDAEFLDVYGDHLDMLEKVGLFFGVGVITGTIGINYAHELLHQKPKIEVWMADLLLAMVMYSHFRSEHVLVHHRYVGTPRDPVTARYNTGFHKFFPRVIWQTYVSAFGAEKTVLRRKSKPWYDAANPFWRYWVLQAAFLALAFAIGGWVGVALFLFQAFVAIWQLELVNYIEHYGLTRKHLGGGKYEYVQPRHSWNSAHKVSNWLLINLQRHSDHHFKADRRFPLLQTYDETEAPQLPYGYPMMTMLAMVPPLWRRFMNPRVREWRRRFYPEIEDWAPYDTGTTDWPR